MSPAIEVRDAFRIYPASSGASVALAGLGLVVEHGEIIVAVGPSGSGKTTLLRAIGGFEPLSAGSVRVFGTELGRLGARELAVFRAANLGFLDQHYARALSPDLGCRDTIAFQLDLLGSEPRESRRVADELLERVGLRDRGSERPQALSGGEQQRVALCAAIAHRPRLLLADEPVGELDAESAAAVYRLIADLARESGTTALVVSHDRGAEAIADRVVRVSEGRAAEVGAPGEVAALVVSRGWLRVPAQLLDDLGNPSTVTLAPRGDELSLRGADTRADLEKAPADRLSDVARDFTVRTSNPARPVAELRNVTKRYRACQTERTVLEALSLTVAEGSLLAIVGRSGTGKTTLLHLLAGIERPTSGEVVVLDQPLSQLGRTELALLRRRHVALVTQEPGLVPHLSAAENVLLGLQLRGVVDVCEESVQEALEDLGLAGRLLQRVSRVSAGERQRVAIARALVTDAELLLVDEPTARLDQVSARLVGRLLRREAREQGRAVVCATHDPALVELADEIVRLDTPIRRRGPGTRTECLRPRHTSINEPERLDG